MAKGFDKTRLALLGCGILYAFLAVVAARSDYPTPERIAKERLLKAFLLANVLDKEFRPYDQPFRADLNAQYEGLQKEFKGRYGEAFDTAKLDEAYLDDLEHMEADRMKLVAFTAASIVAVFVLLHLVWLYVRSRPAPDARKAPASD